MSTFKHFALYRLTPPAFKQLMSKGVLNQFEKTSTKYEQEVAYGKFKGFVSHYHISKGKIDCAALEISALLDEVKAEE